MNKKILIVEDANDIAQAFKKQLDLQGGYDVEIAVGGKQGLEMMAGTQYDLILLDLIMPEIDGIEVLRRLKEDPAQYKKAPVIVLTNVTNEETKSEVEAFGISKFIVKTDTDIDVVVNDFFKS
jgi:CheY-like chemotaxis protein